MVEETVLLSDDEDEELENGLKSNQENKLKYQKKKSKKKRAKERKRAERLRSAGGESVSAEGVDAAANVEEEEKEEVLEDVEIDYVTEGPDPTDPLFNYFSKVFDAFKISDGDIDKVKKEHGDLAGGDGGDSKSDMPKMAAKAAIVERIIQEEEEAKREKMKEQAEKPKMSKRKLRIMMRPSIADLKASTNRPDVVEWHDVTAKDPKLLVHLKSIRNTVPVPRHWCFKRKYLAGKRGFEKPAFDLPDFIKRTGIMEMRQALQEKEDQKTLKTKMREKIRPKMGKIDIDYQKLHDAFFRWQSKPRMTIVGDLYYEGKELETKMRDKKPGELSDELRIALGMPVGPNAHRFPPPWLIAMQRYGPPPSYPNLKVPGLNAPIPDGCSFGYHAGGWGKPPVDETGRPLYGDVFGTDLPSQPSSQDDDEIERKPWGELESEESSSEEEEEEIGQAGEMDDETGLVTPAEGLITPSGLSSGIPTGVETPDSIELRKRKLQEEGGDTPAQLYTVLPERRVDRFGGQMMGSTHVYDLTATTTAATKKSGAGHEAGVEVSLNPDELDTLSDVSGLQQKYQEVKQQQQQSSHDFSDLVVEHAARQTRKRKAQETKKAQQTSSGTASSSKKYKEFKF